MKRAALLLAGLMAVAVTETGCYTPPPPGVAVQAPGAAYVSYTPEYYTWDGNEYVGVAGGQYVYWNAGVWVAAPPVVLGRFHGWERYHPAWRREAIRYHRGERPWHR